MQEKNPSKMPSFLQKGILAKEKLKLDQKLRKPFDNICNYFAHSRYYSKKNPLSSHTPVILIKLSIFYSVVY